MVERSLIACNGIEVIGDCIYETKQIKQQQQQKQQQTFNATLPYTQSLPRVYGYSLRLYIYMCVCVCVCEITLGGYMALPPS